MNEDVEATPFPGDFLEQRLELAGLADIEGHEDRRLKFRRERFDVLSRLFVEVGDRQVGLQLVKRLGAAISDGVVVGDADDQRLLALERRTGDFNGHDVLLLARLG